MNSLSTTHCIYFKAGNKDITVMPYNWTIINGQYVYYCYWFEIGNGLVMNQSKYFTIANSGLEAVSNFKNRTNLIINF